MDFAGFQAVQDDTGINPSKGDDYQLSLSRVFVWRHLQVAFEPDQTES
ncbi:MULTISPECIES: hypothetical protein [unclassified Acinetobacter]|nr:MULTISPECIES: hypothetical protein [unclassified Acinetobacter]ENU81175.1 hypothetical protein F975_01039 [Acinetobacter sp. ANC 3789]